MQTKNSEELRSLPPAAKTNRAGFDYPNGEALYQEGIRIAHDN